MEKPVKKFKCRRCGACCKKVTCSFIREFYLKIIKEIDRRNFTRIEPFLYAGKVYTPLEKNGRCKFLTMKGGKHHCNLMDKSPTHRRLFINGECEL